MARGWESKAVEAQIEESNVKSPGESISPEERQALLKKKDLLLSRRRIQEQLERSPNERYSELLRRTLAGLDAEIAALN
jgi:hypothetical protein